MREVHLMMTPAAGESLVRHVGDLLEVRCEVKPGALPAGSYLFLRTNLGQSGVSWREAVAEVEQGIEPMGAGWRNVPLLMDGGGKGHVRLVLTEAGSFRGKCYLVDADGRERWAAGPDFQVVVHPDDYRIGNTIYCAFPRLFGEKKEASERETADEAKVMEVEKLGYHVLPSSGTLRDLKAQLPHIFTRLNCRVLHLLPISPAPTVYARFGRMGSPYALQHWTAIDPALVEFDQRTSGVDQFRELAHATRVHGGKLFLDLVINHTGWGSLHHEEHPEWFRRDDTGKFISPGAWGTIWEDLVELDHDQQAAWPFLAEVFLTWCERGVDGFRCDAGYKVPLAGWRYIIAKVRLVYPDTIFLLEGLGGSWEATERLLQDGGMHWAYSELFQNYTPEQVADYLEYALSRSQSHGLYVHYSETHDNDRLGKKGREWSLMRNRLCALASVSGGFGFSCGVEWLAREKIDVHEVTGLNWGAADHLVEELAALNGLLMDHPAFWDGATVERLSSRSAPVLALVRRSASGDQVALVLVNLDLDAPHRIDLPKETMRELGHSRVDLLGQETPQMSGSSGSSVSMKLEAGAAYCLAAETWKRAGQGALYRAWRSRVAWLMRVLSEVALPEEVEALDEEEAARAVEKDAAAVLAQVLAWANGGKGRGKFVLRPEAEGDLALFVTRWMDRDRQRVVPVPARHWLLVVEKHSFRARIVLADGQARIVEAVPVREGYVAACRLWCSGEGTVELERFGVDEVSIKGRILVLSEEPEEWRPPERWQAGQFHESLLLLRTNGIGGMSRMALDLGRVYSKYDAVLAANLHPRVPVDRHVFVKRIRCWVRADGFVTALSGVRLAEVIWKGPRAICRYEVFAGGRRVGLVAVEAEMLQGRNVVVLEWAWLGLQDEDESQPHKVELIARVDIEDRNFHTETRRNAGAEHHFASHGCALPDGKGFVFQPSSERVLRVTTREGDYHHEPEWSQEVPHMVEATRGQVASGDAYSPGWFGFDLADRKRVRLVLAAEPESVSEEDIEADRSRRLEETTRVEAQAGLPADDWFGRVLVRAAQDFLVRRDDGKTVIAGYPWFLDWGRDSLICARGLVAAGFIEEVRDLLITFGRFETDGTLPNSIHGEDASNRDTSDAPLWYGLACAELAAVMGRDFLGARVERGGRRVQDVLVSIARGYLRGTPNGIRVDKDSGLVWSPSHFTWMDTNYPAGTPREGYPVEIQALWIYLLRLLMDLGIGARELDGRNAEEMAAKTVAALEERYWLEEAGYYSDGLLTIGFESAQKAKASTALRSNMLLPAAFGYLEKGRARRAVQAATEYLIVPGAIRSLAPLPVEPPLPIRGADGALLNDPGRPYCGRYEGDEDTRRKPAYHNGTAWTWPFPTYCEALAEAWDWSPQAVRIARSYLGSMCGLLWHGCLGHLPEVVDGDAPHRQRGCDAQSWGATEALRVWKRLS